MTSEASSLVNTSYDRTVDITRDTSAHTHDVSSASPHPIPTSPPVQSHLNAATHQSVHHPSTPPQPPQSSQPVQEQQQPSQPQQPQHHQHVPHAQPPPPHPPPPPPPTPTQQHQIIATPIAPNPNAAPAQPPPIDLDADPRRRNRYKNRRSSGKSGESGDDIRKGGRGTSFTPEEALCMAKAWVEESVQAPIGEFTKWGAIQKICADNYGMCRTSESLRCAWSRIAKECQNFITTRLKIEAEHIKDDVTEDEIDALALEAYRRKTGKSTNGIFHYGAPFKYYATAKYLAKQPRFMDERSMTVQPDCSKSATNLNNSNSADTSKELNPTKHANSGTSRQSSGLVAPFSMGLSDKEALNGSSKCDGNPPLDESPSPTRQVDLEDASKGRLRLEDLPEFRNLGDKTAVLRAKGRLAIDLNGGDILGRKRDENLNKRRDEDANDREEDFRLLQMLPRGSPEYMEIIQDMMKERRLRARERLARKELVVLDLERDVRRKRCGREPSDKG